MGLRVAVIGATGLVGREILGILHEREFPIDQVFSVASRRSLGTEVTFGDDILKTNDIETFDFEKVDLVLMAAGGDVAKQWAPKIAEMGVLVIDNSSAFRTDDAVPLIVPEVNADAIMQARPVNIIANPNCSTIQMLVALKPIHDEVGIKRIVAATYQSVSGAGQHAMDELWDQTKSIYVNDMLEPRSFTKQIAFNAIPHIDDFMEDGSTREEWKMRVETHKILSPDVALTASCVRIPTFVGHGIALNIEMNGAMTAHECKALLRESPGMMLVDKREDGGYITPVEAAGEFAVYASRIRKDPTLEHGLSMWVCADNLRKGAALNAVQIAELALNRGVM